MNSAYIMSKVLQDLDVTPILIITTIICVWMRKQTMYIMYAFASINSFTFMQIALILFAEAISVYMLFSFLTTGTIKF